MNVLDSLPQISASNSFSIARYLYIFLVCSSLLDSQSKLKVFIKTESFFIEFPFGSPLSKTRLNLGEFGQRKSQIAQQLAHTILPNPSIYRLSRILYANS